MNVEKTLAACRAELKRHQEMEAKATKGPWNYSQNRVIVGQAYEISVSRLVSKPVDDLPLLALARNLNPARLRVAKELLDRFDCLLAMVEKQCVPMMRAQLADLELAAALLGVEVVE